MNNYMKNIKIFKNNIFLTTDCKKLRLIVYWDIDHIISTTHTHTH